MNGLTRPNAGRSREKLPPPSMEVFLTHAKEVAPSARGIDATDYVMSVFGDQELCTFTPLIRGTYKCPLDGTSRVFITTTFAELYEKLFGQKPPLPPA